MEFEGKSVLVTGGSSGIGAAVAELFVQRGARVFVVARNREKLAALKEKIGEGVTTYIADVGEQEQAEAMVHAAVAEHGGLDIMINNAGIGGVLKRAGEVEPDEWRKAMSVNLDSVFWSCRIAMPHLIASRGNIVNTASLAGLAADYSFTTYTISKTALIALTRSMALDYARDGVRVNCVSPGYVATDLNKNAPPMMAEAFIARTPFGRAGTPEEVAETILFLASPRASYVTGHNLIVDGGIMTTAGLPNVPALIEQLTKK